MTRSSNTDSTLGRADIADGMALIARIAVIRTGEVVARVALDHHAVCVVPVRSRPLRGEVATGTADMAQRDPVLAADHRRNLEPHAGDRALLDRSPLVGERLGCGQHLVTGDDLVDLGPDLFGDHHQHAAPAGLHPVGMHQRCRRLDREPEADLLEGHQALWAPDSSSPPSPDDRRAHWDRTQLAPGRARRGRPARCWDDRSGRATPPAPPRPCRRSRRAPP